MKDIPNGEHNKRSYDNQHPIGPILQTHSS